MKIAIIILSLFIVPIVASAQKNKIMEEEWPYHWGTKKKRDILMNNFMRFYNNKQDDSIRIMFDDSISAGASLFKSKSSFDSFSKQCGILQSYTLIKDRCFDPEGDYFLTFKLAFSKSTLIMYLMFYDGRDKFRIIYFEKPSTTSH